MRQIRSELAANIATVRYAYQTASTIADNLDKALGPVRDVNRAQLLRDSLRLVDLLRKHLVTANSGVEMEDAETLAEDNIERGDE